MKINTQPRLHAAALTLLASLFIVVVYNGAFWRTFITATGNLSWSHLPLHLATFVLIVVLFNAFLTLVNFRYVIKPVLVVLFIATAATSYFMNYYGTQIDRSMVQNLFETDTREAGELLNLKMIGTIVLLGVLPSLALCRLKLTYPSLRRDLLQKLGIVALSGLIVAALLFAFFKSLAPALREHRELRFLLTPTNYIQAVNAYFKQKNSQVVAVKPLGLDAVRRLPAGGAVPRSVTIIVVGETARAQNFSLNGYARQTNPELAAQAGLINFTHVESCGTATAVSLPCVFSSMEREDYSDNKARSQEGLLDVLSHAGFQVLWRDNNSGCKGACDRVAYEDLSQPKGGNPFCVGDECYDERLLERLPDIMRDAKDDLVVVLHQKGSHGPAYDKRYPAKFRRFTPVCQTNELEQCSRESIVAAYDNTILYTDHFLSRTIDLLRQTAADAHLDTAMMYFSDHGESLGEKNMYLHGAPYMLAPSEQRTVPMMLWLSDGFAARYHIDQRCLAARAGQNFSHDNVFHSVLGMLGVGTAVYNPHLDIFGPCTRNS